MYNSMMYKYSNRKERALLNFMTINYYVKEHYSRNGANMTFKRLAPEVKIGHIHQNLGKFTKLVESLIDFSAKLESIKNYIRFETLNLYSIIFWLTKEDKLTISKHNE